MIPHLGTNLATLQLAAMLALVKRLQGKNDTEIDKFKSR